MEDFKAERRDSELAHGRFVKRQRKWEDQLEEVSSERDQLTEEVSMLKEQLDVRRREVYSNYYA